MLVCGSLIKIWKFVLNAIFPYPFLFHCYQKYLLYPALLVFFLGLTFMVLSSKIALLDACI